MIHILWPTIRPEMMIKTYNHWMNNSTNKDIIVTYFAVNTADQQQQIFNLLAKHNVSANNTIYISGEQDGVTHACNFLTHLEQVDGPDQDIVILASDDMYAPARWDQWLISAFKHRRCIAILVNDGYIRQDNVTIPIMSMGCLKRLNRYIYHHSYKHSYSDTELYHNLTSLNLLEDHWKDSPVFEHRNWANSKRKFDDIDQNIRRSVDTDAQNWRTRSAWTIEERLI